MKDVRFLVEEQEEFLDQAAYQEEHELGMGERFRLAVQTASPPTGVAELEVRSVAQAKPQRPAAACRVVQTLTASHRRSQQRRLHLIHRRNRLSPPFGPGLPLRRRLQRKAGGSRSVPVFAPDAREFAAQQGAGL